MIDIGNDLAYNQMETESQSYAILGLQFFVRGSRVDILADAAMMALAVVLFALSVGLTELCDRI